MKIQGKKKKQFLLVVLTFEMIHHKISFRNISPQGGKITLKEYLKSTIKASLTYEEMRDHQKKLLISISTNTLFKAWTKYNRTKTEACGNIGTARLETGRELNYNI